MTVDHFEALFDATYLRWFDIADKGDVTVEITKVRREEVTLRGGAKKMVPIVTFKGAKKEFVLNRTNGESIAELHGPKPSNWIGKKVTLYVTTTNLKGKPVNCIRVRGK